jgi:hypothetical protein
MSIDHAAVNRVAALTRADKQAEAHAKLAEIYAQEGAGRTYMLAKIQHHYYLSEFETVLDLCCETHDKDPYFLDYCYIFANASVQLGQCEEIRTRFPHMIAPYIPWNKLQFQAEVGLILGDDEEIIHLYEQAEEPAPEHEFYATIVRHNIGMSLMRRHGIAIGLELYAENMTSPRAMALLYGTEINPSYWAGQCLPPATATMHLVGGVGDGFMFQRYILGLLAQGCVYIQDAHALAINQAWINGNIRPAFQSIFPRNLLAAPQEHMHVIAFSLFTSFFRCMGYMPPRIPMLVVQPSERGAELIADIRRKAGSKAIVLLFWSANETGFTFGGRSLRLADMLPLLEDEDVHWVVAQRGVERRRFAESDFAQAPHISVLPQDLSFAQTLEVIDSVDKVVSIDSSVLHLAGNILKPTLLMLNNPGEWRWGNHPTATPWYHSVKLVRRRENSGWADVVQRVKAEL